MRSLNKVLSYYHPLQVASTNSHHYTVTKLPMKTKTEHVSNLYPLLDNLRLLVQSAVSRAPLPLARICQFTTNKNYSLPYNKVLCVAILLSELFKLFKLLALNRLKKCKVLPVNVERNC